MRFCFLVFILFTLGSCAKKDITFDVTYEVNAEEFRLENNQLVIEDYPLFLQNNVEKNYSKISLIKEVQLVEVCSNTSFSVNSIEILNKTTWETLNGQIKNKDQNCVSVIDSEKNLKEIFKDNKLGLILTLSKTQNVFPKTLRLKFRFKGKHEKTNIQYRIVA
ncbi:MAG TPA: hypothetical protein PLP27_08025 [Crocinitomicaceae bacterium]|nr:hypothetical protein [Crocinitomicaceae bacterium]